MAQKLSVNDLHYDDFALMDRKQISPVSRLITSHCFGFRPITKEQMELSRQKELLEERIGILEGEREQSWKEKEVIIMDTHF